MYFSKPSLTLPFVMILFLARIHMQFKLMLIIIQQTNLSDISITDLKKWASAEFFPVKGKKFSGGRGGGDKNIFFA